MDKVFYKKRTGDRPADIPGLTYVGTSVNRFVTKVEINNDKESLTDFLRQLLGEERFSQLTEADIDGYVKDIEKASMLRQAVYDYVNPMLEELKKDTSRNGKKKISELFNLGRFVQSLGKINEIQIVDTAEPPDFIIEYKDNLIGIELTGIYNSEVVAEINTAKELLKKCQAKLSTETDIKGNILLNVIPDKLKFPRSQESKVIDEICNYVIANYNQTSFNQPDYIWYMFRQASDTLELVLYENYWLTLLSKESVTERITEKENATANYKDSKKLKACWLLITIDGASSTSSFDYSSIKGFDTDTKFDNVFIYDVFSGKIVYSKFQL